MFHATAKNTSFLGENKNKITFNFTLGSHTIGNAITINMNSILLLLLLFNISGHG